MISVHERISSLLQSIVVVVFSCDDYWDKVDNNHFNDAGNINHSKHQPSEVVQCTKKKNQKEKRFFFYYLYIA